MATRNRGRNKGGKPGAGCIVWLVAMAVILVFFLLNLDSIRSTFKNTRFAEIVGQSLRTTTTLPSSGKTEPAAGAPEAAAPGSPAVPPANGQESGTTPVAPPDSPIPAPVPGKSRVATLFFVRIEDDGVITRQEVKRAIPASDSPLADSLSTLLAGPTEDEIRRKLMTLVPRGTRLLGVAIRGSTAVVDLSEAFMYNHYGIEGYAGQLKQIVYTATAFSAIQDVQILIEGKTTEYLGGEGVYIGRPISRNSF